MAVEGGNFRNKDVVGIALVTSAIGNLQLTKKFYPEYMSGRRLLTVTIQQSFQDRLDEVRISFLWTLC